MRRPGSDRAGFAIAAALALALHAALLGSAGSGSPPVGDATPAAVEVRTIAPPAAVEPAVPVEATSAEPVAEAPTAQAPAAAAAHAAPAPERARATPRPAEPPPPVVAAASAADAAASAALPEAPAPSEPVVTAGAAAASEPTAPVPSGVASGPVAIAEASASSPGAADKAMRDLGTPPPTYRVRLPPPLVARYEVRRGFLRGSGEIRWQPAGDRYAMQLEARIGSIVLLVQSSEGAIGDAGLAPRRFVDQRLRRPAQAANFDADAGRIGFSGPQTTYPLYAGTQDRLSLFVQLAGIAAADPGRLVEGATFPIVVVGSRGDAAVWNLRVAGHEAVETAAGPVQAIKFVREARGPSDTAAEIWLDPARHYMPAHATLRNASGASEYDLLLDGVSSGP